MNNYSTTLLSPSSGTRDAQPALAVRQMYPDVPLSLTLFFLPLVNRRQTTYASQENPAFNVARWKARGASKRNHVRDVIEQMELHSEQSLYHGCHGSYYTRFEALETYIQPVVNGSGQKPLARSLAIKVPLRHVRITWAHKFCSEEI